MLVMVLCALAPGDIGYRFLLLPYSVEASLFQGARAEIVSPTDLRGPEFSGVSYVAGVKAGQASASFKGLRFSGLYLNSGNMESYDENGVYLGDFAYHATCFTVGKSLAWRSYTITLQPELLFQSAASASAFGLALNAGISGQVPVVAQGGFGRLDWGLRAQHMGAELAAFDSVSSSLPMGLSGGMKWTSPGQAWQLGLGLESTLDYAVALNFGAVWWPYGYPIAVAAAYNTKGKQLNTGAGTDILNGLTAGVLFKMGSFKLGYSWTPLGDLGDVHRLQLQLECLR